MKNMLKKLCVTLLAVGSASTAFADDTISHTFFYVRPHFMSGQPERVSNWRDDLIDASENGWGGMAEAVVYGGQSTNHHKMAEYFMPFGKTCLNVYEFNTTSNQDLNRSKDVEARNFNIETVNGTFQSRIKFAPKQSFIGVGLAWKQAFWWCEDHARAWLEISLPIEHVKNSMGLTETVINDGGGVVPGATGLDGAPRVANMIEAFKQASWKYGKIDNKKCHTKTGVADIEFKINWNSALGSCCRLDSYVGFVAPTGTKINAKNAAYVFSPVIGNNHHWGFLFGGHMAFDVWECGKHNVRMEYDLAARIYAPNHQIRSFDLIDKQWGRYLATYSTLDQASAAFAILDPNAGTSGINVFTQCVKVSPRYNADSNTALVYNYCNFVAEVGYNLFVREAENVCLASKWANGETAVQAIIGEGQTSIARNIGKNFELSDIAFVDYADATLTRCDLNLDSAAHPAIISNNIYGTLGYKWETCGMPSSFSIGGSYEFSKVNTTMDRWLAWGKFTIAY